VRTSDSVGTAVQALRMLPCSGCGEWARARYPIVFAGTLALAAGCRRTIEHTPSEDTRAEALTTAPVTIERDVPSSAPATELGSASPHATGLSDDFSGSKLDASWSVLFGETSKIALEGGALQLTPRSNTVWFHADRSVLVHKRVTGDFMVTSGVRARKASQRDRPVDVGYQFGGLIARSPGSDEPGAKENHVFVVVGYRGEFLSVETKTTQAGHSQVEGPKWPSSDAVLRICRVGSELHLYKRAIGASVWEKAASHTRPDLPRTLQVGPIAYAFHHAADLRASFDEVTFGVPHSAADCAR